MKLIIEDIIPEFNIDSYNISTYGGETWLDDYEIREYGIQIGDLTIAEINPEEMKKLGIVIINHLISNGHEFEFYNDNQGNGRRFK